MAKKTAEEKYLPRMIQSMKDRLKNEEIGGLKKLWDEKPPRRCRQHNPPNMIVLSPGGYSYTCPDCGETTTFVVRGTYL